MINISKIYLSSDSTIENALNVINSNTVKIALVVDSYGKLLGTLCDGDIRRGFLKKYILSDTIKGIYSRNFITAKSGSSKAELLDLCLTNKINHVPIIDDDLKVIDLFIIDNVFLKRQYKNNVVLMVGGLGVRLRPLTDNIPKPMLNIGGKPILQTIVKGFVDNGFTNITMCLGYKSNVIQDYFKDGSDFGANIDYIVEKKRMGTAGSLTLLKKEISSPFFVMNGDLLTNVNYEQMLDFHEFHKSKATMCVREYDIEVPYGVVNIDDENIFSIEEKPVHNFFVNAGIYLLDPDCIGLIPKNTYCDMPSLFERIIATREKVVSFPLKEYWLDIGRISEYEQANQEYSKVFDV